MSRLRAGFINRITFTWQKTVQSILEVGRLLLAAKEGLPHGDFTAMVETDLPFSIRTAECLMHIAKHPRLSRPNPHTCANLPPSWRALYELSRLPVCQFDAALRERRICADITVNEARYLADSVEERRTRYETRFSAQSVSGRFTFSVTPAPIPVRTVADIGETRPLLENNEPVLRELEAQRHANEVLDAICSVSKADLDVFVKHLTQNRVADIEKAKEGIEVLRRLGERLGGATIVQLYSGAADRPA